MPPGALYAVGGTLILPYFSLYSSFPRLIQLFTLSLLQSWFMAYAGRGRIAYREDTPDQFPVYRRFHQRNVVSPYRYLSRAHCVNDVTGLTAGQVCFFLFEYGLFGFALI